MEVLFTIGIFMSIFLTLLLLLKKSKSLPDLFLGLFFILIAVNILFSYLEFVNKKTDYTYPWAINITAPIVILYGTVIWFYIKSITTIQFRFKLVHLLHLVPFIIFFTYHYFAFYRISSSERIQMAITESFKDTFLYKFFVLFVAVTTFSYLSWSYQLIKRHQHNIMRYFSNLEKVNLSWLKNLIVGTLLVFILTMGVIVLDLIFHFIDFKIFEFGAFGLASLIVLILGIIGIRQTTIFIAGPTHNIQFSLTEDQLLNQLMEIMKSDKPYQDPDITIGELARLLKVNENELSGLLNRRLNKNFYEFINLYRIESFKEKIIDPLNDRYTFISIAFECGFNSKATFNRVFKKFTNLTPVEYKRRYQKN